MTNLNKITMCLIISTLALTSCNKLMPLESLDTNMPIHNRFSDTGVSAVSGETATNAVTATVQPVPVVADAAGAAATIAETTPVPLVPAASETVVTAEVVTAEPTIETETVAVSTVAAPLTVNAATTTFTTEPSEEVVEVSEVQVEADEVEAQEDTFLLPRGLERYNKVLSKEDFETILQTRFIDDGNCIDPDADEQSSLLVLDCSVFSFEKSDPSFFYSTENRLYMFNTENHKKLFVDSIDAPDVDVYPLEAKPIYIFEYGIGTHEVEPPPGLTVGYSMSVLSEITIALDPGHYGGDMADVTGRQMKMDLDDNDSIDIDFQEGTLNYAAALIMKKWLNDLGAKVVLTREGIGSEALLVNEGYLSNFLSSDGLIPEIGKRDWQRLDILERAKKINNSRADLALSLHLNVTGEKEQGMYDKVEESKGSFFIPGYNFAPRFHHDYEQESFMRQILNNLETRSEILAEHIIEGLEEEVYSKDYHILSTEERYSNFASKVQNGIYKADFAITRLVHNTPIVLLEPFYQNQIDEAKSLNKREVKIDGMDELVPIRIFELAQAYVMGILKYLDADEVDVKFFEEFSDQEIQGHRNSIETE